MEDLRNENQTEEIQLTVTDTEIRNDSDLTLYLTVDGERVVISPASSYPLD